MFHVEHCTKRDPTAQGAGCNKIMYVFNHLHQYISHNSNPDSISTTHYMFYEYNIH